MPEVNLFICYAHEDRNYLETLKAYINPKTFSYINVWYDGEIKPGQVWNKEIRENIDRADIILLLLSQFFLISDYIDDVELKRALERHDAGTCKVIPIFARKCNLDRHKEILRLQGLPEGMKFLSEMGNEIDGHYAIIQSKIEMIANEISTNKNINTSITTNDNKSSAAREIASLQNRKKIFLSVSSTGEGKKRRKEFLYQVEGKIKYENWPYEIVPGIQQLEEIMDDKQEAFLQQQMETSLYSIHIVSDKNELCEEAGKMQYDIARQHGKKDPFHKRIIWYLSQEIKDSTDEQLLKEICTNANIIGCDYENIFEVIKSLEIEKDRLLLLMKKKFSTTKKVLMLYNFISDHNSDLRIILKNKIEEKEGVSFRFNLPNENLQKEKEELEMCHGALIYYGAADSQWYLIRQSLLLDAQNIKSKAVCIDEPGLDIKVRRDVIKNVFITIKGPSGLDPGLDDFLNGLII
jgi:hypothetical protein